MVQQSKKLLLLVIALFSILLLTRVITVSSKLVERVASCCMYPLLVVQKLVVKPLRACTTRKKNIQELTDIIAHYKQQYSDLLSRYISLSAQMVHHRQTTNLAQYAPAYKTDTLCIAQIIVHHCSDAGHFILLDVGTRDGVCQDMIAVYHQCLLGRVSEVYPWYCKVILTTDSLSKVPVICVQTGSQGIYEGLNQSHEARLGFVSHLNMLEIDELVLSSGDGLIYPKGFAVGKIRHFTLDALGLNYIVSVEPLLQVSDIHHCCLVSKGAELLDSAPYVSTVPSN